MPVFVALLRGVNVGKAKRVPMAEFRTLLAGLGYTEIVTLLNSGNAVFRASSESSASHAADIADAIKRRLKIEVPVIVISSKEFESIVSENPIDVTPDHYSRFLVAFVQHPKVLPELSSIGSLTVRPERFDVGKYAAYLYCANGILQSKAGESILGKAGRSATTRNWATVLKLRALVNEL